MKKDDAYRERIEARKQTRAYRAEKAAEFSRKVRRHQAARKAQQVLIDRHEPLTIEEALSYLPKYQPEK